jgi:hypothetical protein
MYHALFVGFGTMTLLAVILLVLRARVALLESRLREAEELAAALGLIEDGDDYQDDE